MKKDVYLIGNAHIDPVWQWRWQEGFQEIKATFKSVLDRMKEFSDFKFTCAGSMYYEWIEKSDKKMFEEICQRVKEGRWCIAGGWYLQPDCNIPCGEAFAREGLIAQRYFLEKFGRKAEVGYNVDSLGHNGALPQILKKSGLRYYVFMRPDNREKALPCNLFAWVGVDGTEILTYRIPFAYGMEKIENIEKVKTLATEQNTAQMAFFGMGNHGGGPTIKLLSELDALLEKDSAYTYATVDEYFRDVEDKQLEKIKGDLQYHARGCYSLSTMIKKYNRLAENHILRTETFGALAENQTDYIYPKQTLESCWKELFLCQFHDNLAGTIIKPAYEDMRNAFGYIVNRCEQETNLALSKISWEIDTLQGHSESIFREDRFFPFVHEKLGSPVVVFNPLPYAVKQAVRIYPKCSMITDYDDNPILSQVVRGFHTDGYNVHSTLAYVEVPAFGYKVLKIFKEKLCKQENSFSFGEDYIENTLIKVVFDLSTGGIKAILDKTTGRNYLSDSTAVALIDETEQDAWTHDTASFDKVVGVFKGVEMHIIESGPVRVTMRVSSKCGENKIRQDISLYPDSDKVFVTSRLEIKDEHRMVKIRIPANVESDAKAECAIPYGKIERTTDNAENPCGEWFTVTDGKNGIAVCNDSKYSFSVDKNTAYLTVLRTAIYLDHFANVAKTRDEFCDYIDTDENEFTYTIEPYKGIAETVRSAQSLNNPFQVVMETFHKGTLKTSYCGVKVEQKNIIVTALKRAEDGNGYILRAYECDGKKTRSKIHIECLKARIDTGFLPYEIKTFRIVGNTVSDCNLIEESV